MTRVVFNPRSKNTKTGPIPTATVEKATCPPSCPLLENGCYSNSGMSRYRWDEVGVKGIRWSEFCKKIEDLKPGTLWRYAIAGDLPGDGDEIDFHQVADLLLANKGKSGFTFTHKPLTSENRQKICFANAYGFRINLSAWDAKDADVKLSHRIAPVVCMIPWGTPVVSKTPAGAKVVACPAQTRAGVTCASCKLCSKERSFVIGFYPHGPGRANGGKDVNERLLG